MVAKISVSKISPRELVQFKNSIKIISLIKNISNKPKLINHLNFCKSIR